jgi:molybdate/tungstate transport system substrate-binding protein
VSARRIGSLALLFVLAVVSGTSCQAQIGGPQAAAQERTPLRVFIAGSLVVPFAALEQAYEAAHPQVDVQVEPHGSIQVIRHVSELHELIDVIVPADYALIPLLMYASTDPQSGAPYADWAVQFAGNELVLAYTDASLAADEIGADNWYEVLARPEVRFGLSDPRFDAAGYRSLMIAQLAEAYYGDPTLFERLYLGRFKEALTVEKAAGLATIHVPELLETSPGSSIVLRGSSVALLGLLESGDIDYAFEYLSVARQHNLRYLQLPPELNLSDPAQAEWYAGVQVQLDFQRFASVRPVFTGERILYGLTIPANAPHPAEAQAFAAFLLGPQGAQVMADNHHPTLTRPAVDHPEALPDALQPLVVPLAEAAQP